ncbi:Signal transduction histidine kinase [Nannocystis exedens]|uniref:histidine kinase n=1 Tax=Nannocystis exedens TaxID=54 RepID=A0A1I1WIU2_9BACT|nr:hybrid sensor histidine kinase/response regulator [Nannocystis exedens]PCC67704.1 hybrid sensor histidine kinase/response regulator [Nannocystis exedens]SFD94298.1 Signal transduction histidine kinase [Nannocystis exedens]
MHALTDSLAATIEALSRELALVVTPDGRIEWADARAQRHGLQVATDLRAAVVPGCEEKLDELLRRAAEERVTAWELALVLAGKPVTLSFSARPAEARIALVASFLPQDLADAIHEAARAVTDIVNLNRQLARQKTRLEESNKAVRALHAELEQHADRLRTSAEIKSRVVAGVSHEFRTPLHSILGLSRLLLSGSDGPLNDEQQTQVAFIRDSAEELSRMIDDMLDLSRLDAGNATIRAARFALRDFWSALRGAMRPLVRDDHAVELVFEPAPDVELETDQGKLAQILRNLIANALKFTERGVVRVSAVVEDDDLRVAVEDTGIGIAPEDHARVFEEFVQIDGALQRAATGAGLGLPLAKKLAEALGGRIELDSTPGAGSIFTVFVPLEHAENDAYRRLEQAAKKPDPTRAPVLVVEDDRSAVFVYERYLSMAGFQPLPNFLADIKRDPTTHDVPVLVCTAMNRESRSRALGADEFWLKPVDEDKLIRKLHTLASGRGAKVLVVDDEPAARYLIKKFLESTPYQLLEAADGTTGVQLARSERPDVILLDFLLANMTAFDVLDQLKADPRTRPIPVIIVTSHALPVEERRRLAESTEAILSKEHLSRELAINRIRDALRHAGIRERPPGSERGGA